MAIKRQFGDFQTPANLSKIIGHLLLSLNLNPKAIIEPTCGIGSILMKMIEVFPNSKEYIGLEVNPDHVNVLRAILVQTKFSSKTKIINCNFFDFDWTNLIRNLPQPILIVGNFPWVTNTALSKLDSNNLPHKTNYNKLPGIQALTGKSNFDISEWMFMHLLRIITDQQITSPNTFAMICKLNVARKIMLRAVKSKIPISNTKLFLFDSKTYFNTTVNTCLFITQLDTDNPSPNCEIYSKLKINSQKQLMIVDNNQLIAIPEKYRATKYLQGQFKISWRSGVKHDCIKVMVLAKIENKNSKNNSFQNGFGKFIELENDFLYPLLKSTDLAKNKIESSNKWIIITQQYTSQSTDHLKKAPLTWAYLNKNIHLFNQRKSSIYKNRPKFSIFGVGPYTFAPFKIAISGMHKTLNFNLINPNGNKPIVLDDTSYFLPFNSEKYAKYYLKLLNNQESTDFLNSRIFWDNKRPIKKEILQILDLDRMKTDS